MNLRCLAPPQLQAPGFSRANLFCNGGFVSLSQRSTCTSATTDSKSSSGKTEESSGPEWAKPGSDVPPPWARGENQTAQTSEGFDLPYGVYLLASTIVAIAAVGSVFEYFNKNPVFGVIQPDNPLYTPVLGFFAITGLPFAVFLWLRAIKLANNDNERQDREDGFL